jgi:hypothetical protein
LVPRLQRLCNDLDVRGRFVPGLFQGVTQPLFGELAVGAFVYARDWTKPDKRVKRAIEFSGKKIVILFGSLAFTKNFSNIQTMNAEL